MSHTVKLKKYVDNVYEKVANAAITPGHLLELMSTNKVKVHASLAGVVTSKMFALEDELQGKEIDDAYAADDVVQVWNTVPGEIVNAILKDGETIVIGDSLESGGDGTLQKYTAGTVVGIAEEALDLSGSSGEETTNRLAVKIV